MFSSYVNERFEIFDLILRRIVSETCTVITLSRVSPHCPAWHHVVTRVITLSRVSSRCPAWHHVVTRVITLSRVSSRCHACHHAITRRSQITHIHLVARCLGGVYFPRYKHCCLDGIDTQQGLRFPCIITVSDPLLSYVF